MRKCAGVHIRAEGLSLSLSFTLRITFTLKETDGTSTDKLDNEQSNIFKSTSRILWNCDVTFEMQNERKISRAKNKVQDVASRFIASINDT